MQRFRRSLFEKYRRQGMSTRDAGTAAKASASWLLATLYCPKGDLSKFHRRETDSALIEASRKRRFMQNLLATPATHRANQLPFMPMRCKGGMVDSTQERARLVANDVRNALFMARYHRKRVSKHFP